MRRHIRPSVLAVLVLGAALPIGAARAESTVASMPENVLQLSASGSVEVPPDQLTIVLAATREGPEAAAVQSQLTSVVEQALAQARAAAEAGRAEVRTGSFFLQPRYGRDARIQGWTGRAEVIVEGADFARVTRMAGSLGQLTVASVGFMLSRGASDRAQSTAQQQAVEAFKARALQLARAFGFNGYTLREVTVQPHEQGIPPRPRLASMAVAADAAPVPVEPGRITVTVTVTGSVQMR